MKKKILTLPVQFLQTIHPKLEIWVRFLIVGEINTDTEEVKILRAMYSSEQFEQFPNTEIEVPDTNSTSPDDQKFLGWAREQIRAENYKQEKISNQLKNETIK